MIKPHYSQAPIRSVDDLARLVDLPTEKLWDLARRSSHLYVSVPQRKKDGSFRQTWDALPRLKYVQGRIKTRILCAVTFPTYLQGGIRDPKSPRDYANNARIHTRQAALINEDVADFFPSITEARVEKIWREVFRFSPEVASCLTQLTTRHGTLPQGARTSNHLANLALFDTEPQVVEQLKKRGMRYSRLTDDISVSAGQPLSNAEKRNVVGTVYGMLRRAGVRPKRRKHCIVNSGDSMLVNGLVTNKVVGLQRNERDAIRAEVHRHITGISNGSVTDPDDPHLLGRLGKLFRFHPAKADRLKARLAKVKRIAEGHGNCS